MLTEIITAVLAVNLGLYVPLAGYVIVNQARKLESVDKTLVFTACMYISCYTLRLLTNIQVIPEA